MSTINRCMQHVQRAIIRTQKYESEGDSPNSSRLAWHANGLACSNRLMFMCEPHAFMQLRAWTRATRTPQAPSKLYMDEQPTATSHHLSLESTRHLMPKPTAGQPNYCIPASLQQSERPPLQGQSRSPGGYVVAMAGADATS